MKKKAEEWIVGSDGKNLKFKREALLNYGMNRWGLNKTHSVGAMSELIRECAPKSFEEWERFYFDTAKQKKKNGIKITPEYIKGLGQTLYIKLSEVVQNELESITEKECVDYAYNLVLNRTYEGYRTEIDTVYGQMQTMLQKKIEPAPDEWDRKYGVDFFVQVGESYVGLQIKPISSSKSLNDYQWIRMHEKSHAKFQEDHGGKVFFIYSVKGRNQKKEIHNKEVIAEILAEIERLSQ